MEPQPENLIQTAWQICNLINELNDLLWEQYGDAFLQIYLQEEDEKFLRTLGVPKDEEEDPSA
jgi:hypothetical protein